VSAAAKTLEFAAASGGGTGYGFHIRPMIACAGAVLLSGDAVHFKANWDARGVPGGNFDKEKTASSMTRMADVMAKDKAQLWINQDKPQRQTLKLSPAFYE